MAEVYQVTIRGAVTEEIARRIAAAHALAILLGSAHMDGNVPVGIDTVATPTRSGNSRNRTSVRTTLENHWTQLNDTASPEKHEDLP